MIAVVPVRDGVLPRGALEVIAEANGSVLLIGSGVSEATELVREVAAEIATAEVGPFRPGAWAVAIAGELTTGGTHADESLVLPHSPDGRDLAPRIAAAIGRPLLAGAIEVTETEVHLARRGGLVEETVAISEPIVATLLPGVRAVPTATGDSPAPVTEVDFSVESDVADADLVEQLPPDPSTMDLAEAPRIVGGGAGLGSAAMFETLATLAELIGASTGGTRVVTDWDWLPFERQIGTTGVTVDPRLYLAFGISGAVQHTAGLGSPDHVISVNTDPHCPMMQMADVALVADAPAVLAALVARLTE